MRRIVAFILTLFLLLVMYNASAGGDGDRKQKKYTKEEVTAIASSLLSAIHDYKYEQKNQCIAILRNKLGFELVKDVTHNVPKNCTVDSLVVGNDEMYRWAYFKSVDLEYLKDVEAMITLKIDQSDEVAESLARMLMQEGFDITSESNGTYVFKDTMGGYVIDNRFKVKTKSRIPSRYSYSIQVMENYLILDVKEVVSDYWVPSYYLIENNDRLLAEKF